MKSSTTATTAVYTRISKDRAEGKGVERQAEDCVALAKRRGWALAGKYEDNDISASKYTRRKRPAYTALMHEVTEGRVQRIIAWKFDRLYRRPKELEALIDLAEAGRVEIVTVLGGDIDLNTSQGRAMARVSVAMAAASSEDTSDRATRQKAQRRAEGKPAGGPPAFGWKRVGPTTDRRLVPDPSQAKVLVAAMDAVLGGESLSNVARRWNTDKVRGRTTWDANNLAKLLTRPLHAGLLVHRGAVLDTPGNWDALITREKHEALVATVAGRSALGSTTPRRRSLLTGLLVCGICGKSMYRATTGKTSDPHSRRTWRCNPLPRTGGCGRVSIRAAAIEPLLVEATMQYVDTVDLAKLLSKTGGRSQEGNIAQELARLDKREAEMGAAVAAGIVKVNAMVAFTKTIEAQRVALRAKLAGQVRAGALAPFAGRPGALRAAWTTLSTDQQRAIIAESLHVVTVLPAEHRGQRFETKRVVWRKR